MVRRNSLVVVGLLFVVSVMLSPLPGLGAEFDHSTWSKILAAHVSEEGWVDYRALRSRSADDLKAYIRALGEASLNMLSSPAERKAFWINAYNAVCIQLLLDAGTPKTVPKALFFGKNIFSEETYRIAGKVRSLDEMEHEILRKRFRDNRIHAALVCGASSCPRLRPEAYLAKGLDRQLDEEARRWIQVGRDKKGKRKNYLDRERKIYHASKIFDWFQEDFGGSEEGVLQFIRRHATAADREFLEKNRVKVEYLTYDWSLNGKD